MLNKQILIYLKEKKGIYLFSVIVSYLFKCMQREMVSFLMVIVIYLKLLANIEVSELV